MVALGSAAFLITRYTAANELEYAERVMVAVLLCG
jgi:hypothetical protein